MVRCGNSQLLLQGTFNECAAQRSTDSQYCEQSGTTLSDVLTLRGTSHTFLLYLSVVGSYKGAGDYFLAPSPGGPATSDHQPMVAIREYQTGAFWQSVSGTLHVDRGGRSGGVAVNLTFVGGEPTPAAIALGILGLWHC
jgi:hypothetical protein